MSDDIKTRMIRTSIWTTSRRFRKLDVVQKLLYLFLLTNHQHSLCGAFELFEDDIAHYTGIDIRNLPHVFEGLKREGLATYSDGWVVLIGYKVKESNPSVQTRIKKDRERIPLHIIEILDGVDRVSTGCGHPATHKDLDSDLDSDLEEKSGAKAPSPTRRSNLVEKYGEPLITDYEQRVRDYMASKGKRYKDIPATVANWIRKDELDGKLKRESVEPRTFGVLE